MAKAFKFSEGYRELEEIVRDFESREIDLEKDLPVFTKGLELAKKLQERLNILENTVEEVVETTAPIEADHE